MHFQSFSCTFHIMQYYFTTGSLRCISPLKTRLPFSCTQLRQLWTMKPRSFFGTPKTLKVAQKKLKCFRLAQHHHHKLHIRSPENKDPSLFQPLLEVQRMISLKTTKEMRSLSISKRRTLIPAYGS